MPDVAEKGGGEGVSRLEGGWIASVRGNLCRPRARVRTFCPGIYLYYGAVHSTHARDIFL
jgi:hypothetical protein